MRSMRQGIEVKKRVEDRLLAIPGVHAVGFGAKVSAGKPAGEFAIIVHVATKKKREELRPDELIPSEIDGVKTDVVESSPRKVRFAPLQGGDEINAEHNIGGAIQSATGTLGCVARTAAVKDTDPPDVLISCRHVLYQKNDAGKPGDEVTIPSCSGCCTPTVAKVLDSPDINTDIDAAIAKLQPGTETKAQIHGLPVKGILDLLDPNLPEPIQLEILSRTYRVYQYGEKSGLTRGVIASIHSTTQSPPHTGQIEVAPVGRDYFSQEGDSGSVVYNDSGQIVGLHWGGDDQSQGKPPFNSFANHISRVLNTLALMPTGPIRIATNPPEVIYRVPGVRNLPPALERVHKDLVAAGCSEKYLRLYGTHKDELTWLLEHSRLFISAWHRYNGPIMVRELISLAEERTKALPEKFGERTWADCVRRIAGALLLTGSSLLQFDVVHYIPFMTSLGGRTYSEILDLLRGIALAND